MKSTAVIVAILLGPLPISAASYPKFGIFISRPGKRLWMLVAGVVLGLVGLVASVAELIPFKAGCYFWSPLWQIAVVQVSCWVWFRVFRLPPGVVVFNSVRTFSRTGFWRWRLDCLDFSFQSLLSAGRTRIDGERKQYLHLPNRRSSRPSDGSDNWGSQACHEMVARC